MNSEQQKKRKREGDSSNGNRNLIKQTRRAVLLFCDGLCRGKKKREFNRKRPTFDRGQEMKQWQKNKICTEHVDFVVKFIS
jgi:hypothetical protein